MLSCHLKIFKCIQYPCAFASNSDNHNTQAKGRRFDSNWRHTVTSGISSGTASGVKTLLNQTCGAPCRGKGVTENSFIGSPMPPLSKYKLIEPQAWQCHEINTKIMAHCETIRMINMNLDESISFIINESALNILLKCNVLIGNLGFPVASCYFDT